MFVNFWESWRSPSGGDQWVHLGDNTGESGADDIQLVFDAIRLTRLIRRRSRRDPT